MTKLLHFNKTSLKSECCSFDKGSDITQPGPAWPNPAVSCEVILNSCHLLTRYVTCCLLDQWHSFHFLGFSNIFLLGLYETLNLVFCEWGTWSQRTVQDYFNFSGEHSLDSDHNKSLVCPDELFNLFRPAVRDLMRCVLDDVWEPAVLTTIRTKGNNI